MTEERSITIPRTVYIRALDRADLPEDLQKATEGVATPYAVHAPNGDRLAIVKDRKLAFILARQNDFTPVYVH